MGPTVMGPTVMGPTVMGEDAARGLVAVGGAEPLAGLVDVPVDGVLGQPQGPSDLLGAHMLVDQAQAVALARRQPLDVLAGLVGSPLGHGMTLGLVRAGAR